MRHIIVAFFGFFVLTFFGASRIDAQTAGSVSLRLVAVNPSEQNTQTAPVKVYLPVEVKPEHILFKSDLEVAYDTQQGSYYVYGEYELKPKEVLEKEVEIKDIWVIEESQILGLRKEATSVFAGFKKTNFADKAVALQKDIDKKLTDIEDVQRVAANNPAQHISDFRYCKGLFTSAENDLASAQTLLAEVKPHGLAELTWKMIVFIIIFLGVLGLFFYIIWQRQAKLLSDEQKFR